MSLYNTSYNGCSLESTPSRQTDRQAGRYAYRAEAQELFIQLSGVRMLVHMTQRDKDTETETERQIQGDTERGAEWFMRLRGPDFK